MGLRSEVLSVNPSSNHVSDWLTGPLWGHVADALDSDEVQTIVLFNVARYLTLGKPGSPLSFNWPVQHLNPLFAAIGSNCTISVTGVEQEFVLVSKNWVDPH